jgi:hypothetical protein
VGFAGAAKLPVEIPPFVVEDPPSNFSVEDAKSKLELVFVFVL